MCLKFTYNLYRAGGPWLVTDMRRGESILELDVCVQEEIELGIESDGSSLSGVSARCSWVEADPDQISPCPSGLFHSLFSPLIVIRSCSQH